MRNGKRIPELDALRGIAIFGVLVLHSSFESRFTPETLAVQATMARLFDWAVLAFFFSSGMLHDGTVPLTTALKKRFMSLLVPFFIYNFTYNLAFMPMASMGWVHSSAPQENPEWLAGALLHSPAFQLYFLPYLFVTSLAICVLTRLARSYFRWAYAVTLLMVALFYVVQGYPQFSYGPTVLNIPLYLAAMLMGALGKPLLDRKFANAWPVVVTLGVALCILVFLRLPVISLAVPPLFVCLARAIPRVGNSKLLDLMGAMSGSIYLWHTPIILPAITRLLAYCGIPSLLNFFGSIILALVFCVLLRIGLKSLFTHLMKRDAPQYITF